MHGDHLPESLRILRQRGIPVLPHAVSLSLGGADPVDMARVEHLAAVADLLDAPLASDHICFVRAGGLDSGHLLPVPRTRDALEVLTANVSLAQSVLGVPLALENVAALVEWPDAQLTEGQFLAELVSRTDCLLLIDVANMWANARNLGHDPLSTLDELPLDKIAYVHVAGGVVVDGVYHDTHAHPVPPEVLDLLSELCGRVRPAGVLLERDDRYPADTELAAELAAIRTVVGRP